MARALKTRASKQRYISQGQAPLAFRLDTKYSQKDSKIKYSTQTELATWSSERREDELCMSVQMNYFF
jgi:hypothetical protein